MVSRKKLLLFWILVLDFCLAREFEEAKITKTKAISSALKTSLVREDQGQTLLLESQLSDGLINLSHYLTVLQNLKIP